MTCQDVLAFLDAYLDEELTVLETLRVDEHLGRCETCRQVRDSEAHLHALLAADAVRDAPPARLRERISTLAIQSESNDGRHSWRNEPGARAVLACALTALLLFGVLLAAGTHTPAPGPGPLTMDVVGVHLDAEQTAIDLELPTSDPSRLASWLEHRVGPSVGVPAVAPSGERVVGARMSWIASQEAAHLLYEGEGRRISLFITRDPFHPGERAAEQIVEGEELYFATLAGVRVAWWSSGGHLYVAAARASEAELLNFAALCVRLARQRPFGILRARGNAALTAATPPANATRPRPVAPSRS
jgi:anti-sigma factor RsiW